MENEKITQGEILKYARIGLAYLIEGEEKYMKDGFPTIAEVRLKKYRRQLEELWRAE